MGKSTLIQDFVEIHPNYITQQEPFYDLDDEVAVNPELPSFEFAHKQLQISLHQIAENAHQPNIIFDRCPVDFLVYAMCVLEGEGIDLEETEIAEQFVDIKRLIATLDLIAFIPIAPNNTITYSDDFPELRVKADAFFKEIFRDDRYSLFPNYNQPRIIEVTGNRNERVKQMASYLS